MLILKTSAATLASVVANQKHALVGMPRHWHPGELALISKNRTDCRSERQIQWVMTIDDIREILPGESQHYWPGTEGRWRFLVVGHGVKALKRPFDLSEVLGADADYYSPVVTVATLKHADELRVQARLDADEEVVAS